jgi:hypothetical protein
MVIDGERRLQLEREALAGYAHGPDAQIEAAAEALAMAESARVVVLVEGISDQIAVETSANRRQRDLDAEGIVVVPMGGAHAIRGYLGRFGPEGSGISVTGLCDAGEEKFFRQGLEAAGIGSPGSRREMAELGFFVCVQDLEDELIRASGQEAIETLLDSQEDLDSFRTLQKQPEWRHKNFDAQMHRWLRAGAHRNLRYARLLARSLPLDQMPHPIDGVLAATSSA